MPEKSDTEKLTDAVTAMTKEIGELRATLAACFYGPRASNDPSPVQNLTKAVEGLTRQLGQDAQG